jgi:DNA polymerase-1
MTTKTVYIIDGYAQIYRAYHAIRSLSSPVTQEPTNATFGFVGMLLKLFKACKPDYVIVALDVGGDQENFRATLYPEYKATRKEQPNDMPPQVARIKEICSLWHIPVIGVPGYEADDVIATLCTRLSQRDDLAVKIVSRDKDLEQLLCDCVSMYDVHTDVAVDVAGLKAEKGLTPQQVIDTLALIGDTVDNIKGVTGVGPKTAAKLIAQYGNIENLLAHTDELSGKLKENIVEARDRLLLNRKLVSLVHDVPFEFDLEQARCGPVPVDTLRPIFKQLGFSRHLNELESFASPPAAQATSVAVPPTTPKRTEASGFGGLFDAMDESQAPHQPSIPQYAHADPSHYRCITTLEELDALVAELTAHISAGGSFAFDTETSEIDPMRSKLCGVSLSWREKQGVYIPTHSCEPSSHLTPQQVIDKLAPLFKLPGAVKIGQNMKFDLLVLRNAGLELPVNRGDFDTMIASYLIDATRSSHKLDNLSLAFLGHEMIPIEAIIGSGKKQRSMSELKHTDITTYAAEDADITLRLKHKLEPMLKVMGLTELFNELEMPIVEVLAELEFNGILIDPAELDRQKKTIDARITEVHEEILRQAGTEFNPDSPPQLAEVLFKKLKCTVLKRGKTGPSTDSEVLQRIADEQPPPGSIVAALILEYRQLTKLRGTYLESLKEAINPRTGRIHASFNQTVAATGRLSSSDPNLQNIPIRTELGRQIRRAFIAPPGHVLLSADYSQIELRLLAHLSQDRGLMEAFEKDIDIHTAVAAETFGVALDQVTPEQRSTAKMVNFGIVYGITPFGLARRLPPSAAGSNVEVARKIIDDYKRRYPKIDAFLAHCIEMADTRGYVETMWHRRRPIPEIRSNNPNIAGLGRRMAINTVVQGSAADLIKTAMVRLHRRIRAEALPMKMLLQIHDELVFETPADQAEKMAAIVQHEMQNAMKLSVPLKVELGWGATWFDS